MLPVRWSLVFAPAASSSAGYCYCFGHDRGSVQPSPESPRAAWLIFAEWLIPHIDGEMSPLFLVLSICSGLAAVVLSILVTPDRVETGEIPRPSSSRRRWLGSSAVVTSGLVLALGIYNNTLVFYDHPIVPPSSRLLFLVGWLLLGHDRGSVQP